MSRFRSLSWRVLVPLAVVAMLAAPGAVALTADQHPRAVTRFAVYDGRGRFVADVLGVPDPDRAVIALKVDTRLVTLAVMRDGLMGMNATIGTPLLYESLDCSGQAFDAHAPGDIAGSASWAFPDIVFTNGLTLYLTDGGPRSMQTNSIRDEIRGVCQPSAADSSVQQPVAPLGTTLQFQAPFTLRAVTSD